MINFKLKAARVERNIKQKDLSKILGISPEAYSMKECGKRKFTLEEVQSIVDALKLSSKQMKYIFFTKELNTNSKTA